MLHMLSSRKFMKYFLLLLINIFLLWTNRGIATNETTSKNARDLANLNLMNLLTECERSEHITADTLFASLLAEFVIKGSKHVRFFEPTRYEQQLYANIRQRLGTLIARARSDKNLKLKLSKEQETILEQVFQKNMRTIEPKLKRGHIDTRLEFESLIMDYEYLIGTGFPNGKQSDHCLASIVTNQLCVLNKKCIDVITSVLPSFGYQRTHQILLLYVFMHHKCAQFFGSQAAPYEILARRRCSQVYREQNVMRSLNKTDAYKDLYLEQLVVCGLLGYSEFLNWRNVNDLILSWPREGTCWCQFIKDNDDVVDVAVDVDADADADADLNDCKCSNHINSLALVYLINAILLLN